MNDFDIRNATKKEYLIYDKYRLLIMLGMMYLVKYL